MDVPRSGERPGGSSLENVRRDFQTTASTDLPNALAQGTVYLVLENIRDLSISQEEFLFVLSEEERQRAARFHFEDDRIRSRVAWGLMRMFLGKIMDQDPSAVEIMRDDFQKPFLHDGPSFNLAHSGDWVLLGVSAEGRLGVDMEASGPIRDLRSLAKSIFSFEEIGELETYPESQRLSAFYRGWTRKEAFVKALGQGISVPLKQFAVTLAPGVAQTLRWAELPLEKSEEWWVQSLPDLPNAFCALAWDRAVEKVQWVDPGSLFCGDSNARIV